MNRPYLHANGTRVVYLGQIEQGWECIALRYWNTDVVRWYRNVANKRNKWFSVNAQYYSNTTKKRIQTSTGVNHLWMDKVTGHVCLGDLGDGYGSKSGVEKPVIADHETWLKRDKGVLKVRYKKRCEARRQNMVSAFTKRKSDQYYEAMNRLHDTALRRVKLLEDWMTKPRKKNAITGAPSNKGPRIPVELARFGEKTVEETLREIALLQNRVVAAQRAAHEEEKQYVDLPERYETTKRIHHLNYEEGQAIMRMREINSFNEMIEEKKVLKKEIDGMKSFKRELIKREELRKEVQDKRKELWSLKTEVQNAERAIRLAETITTIHQANEEKARLKSEVDDLKEELAYLLKMKEGTTPEGFVDFLNRL